MSIFVSLVGGQVVDIRLWIIELLMGGARSTLAGLAWPPLDAPCFVDRFGPRMGSIGGLDAEL